MSKFDLNIVKEKLEKAGFVLEARTAQSGLQYFLSETVGPARVDKEKAAICNPWQIQAVTLSERRQGFNLAKLETRLHYPSFKSNLILLLKKYLGPKTTIDVKISPTGDIWCVFEFAKPFKKDLKRQIDPSDHTSVYGFAGVKLKIMFDGIMLHLVQSDHFGFGYIPANFLGQPLRLALDALRLRELVSDFDLPIIYASLFEVRVPIQSVILTELVCRGVNKENVSGVLPILLDARPAQSPLMRYQETGVQCRISQLEKGEGWQLASLFPLPIEVLEAREIGRQMPTIDEHILAGRSTKALALVTSALESRPQDLFLLRRDVLLSLCKGDPGIADAGQGLKLEPENKLFLSALIAKSIHSGQDDDTLKFISELGSILMQQIPEGDDVSAFDLVMPETLGDVWSGRDVARATECYHRVLQMRGEIPRVLRKLAELYRKADRSASEMLYLERLSAVERRHSELAKIYLRMAELRSVHSTGWDESVEFCQRAIQYDRSFAQAVLLLSELLQRVSRFDEAISAVDSILNDHHVQLKESERSRLESTIGLIWAHKLLRTDLAESRLRRAVDCDQSNFDALLELELIYRKHGNFEGLVYVLEIKLGYFESRLDRDMTKKIFDELVLLLRGPLKRPKDAYALYQRILTSPVVDTIEIDQVLQWNDVQIDWRDLYERLYAKAMALPHGKNRALFLSRVAEICRDKLLDKNTAVSLYREALTEGWIDDNGFEYLTESLRMSGDEFALCEVLMARLKYVGPEGKFRIWSELTNLHGVLSDHQRDDIAINLASFNAEGAVYLQRRFYYYQSIEDLAGIGRLFSMSSDRLKTPEWYRFAIGVVDGMNDVNRFEFLEARYRELLDLERDRTAVLRDAVKTLKIAPNSKMLLFYVVELLRAGEIAELSEQFVTTLLLGHDEELALYHQLLSEKTKSVLERASHAQISSTIYSKLPGFDHLAEKMLGVMCLSVLCTDDDLKNLQGYVTKSGNWPILAKVLQKQIDLTEDLARRYVLLEQLGVVYWKKIKDLAHARLTFILALKIAPEPPRVKLVLANIASQQRDVGQEKKALVDFILDPMSVAHMDAMKRSVERLVRLGDDIGSVHKILQPRIDEALNKGDYVLAGNFSELLILNGLSHTELHKAAFRAAIMTGRLDSAVDHWWRGLAGATNRNRAKAYMAETRLWADKSTNQELLTNCYKAALTNRVGDRLGPQVHHELLIQYGALLFEVDGKRKKALAAYKEAFSDDPNDARSWLPLYFLLGEFGSPSERLSHLEAILPSLEQDQKPLKNFPLTVESLRAEAADLLLQVGGKEGEALKESASLAIDEPRELQAASGSDLVEVPPNFTVLEQVGVGGEESRPESGLLAVELPIDFGGVSQPPLASPPLFEVAKPLGEEKNFDLDLGPMSSPVVNDHVIKPFDLDLGDLANISLDVLADPPPPSIPPPPPMMPVSFEQPEVQVVFEEVKVDEAGSEDHEVPDDEADSEEAGSSESSGESEEAHGSMGESHESVMSEERTAELSVGSSDNSQVKLGASDDGVDDWRAIILRGDFNADLTEIMMRKAFANEVEKHIAIQCVGLVGGNCHQLKGWHWSVWRNANEYGYGAVGKDRLPPGYQPPHVNSTLHKYLQTAAPLLVAAFRSRFRVESLGEKLGISLSAIARARKAMDWNEGILQKVGIGHYKERIDSLGLKAFTLVGMGKTIFYDAPSKHIYFDEIYYSKVPPSHLFIRMLTIVWSLRMHYFVPLAIDPKREFLPIFQSLSAYFGPDQITKMRTYMKLSPGIRKALGKVDGSKLALQHEKIGQLTEEALAQLWDAMRQHTNRLILGETLNLIGLTEAILDKDLLQPNATKHSEIYKLSPYIRELIDFATKIQV